MLQSLPRSQCIFWILGTLKNNINFYIIRNAEKDICNLWRDSKALIQTPSLFRQKLPLSLLVLLLCGILWPRGENEQQFRCCNDAQTGDLRIGRKGSRNGQWQCLSGTSSSYKPERYAFPGKTHLTTLFWPHHGQKSVQLHFRFLFSGAAADEILA